MFLSVQMLGQVDPGRVGHIARLTHNDVLPGLVRAIGRSLVLPDHVSVLPSRAGASTPDGVVPAVLDTSTGAILSIDPPRVCASDDDDLLRFILTHELAHYHELTLRRAREISLKSPSASRLWSEYYAQRVVWACAAMPSWINRPSASPNRGAAGSRGWGYLFAWVLAHHDHTPDWLEGYDDDMKMFLSTIVPQLDPERRLKALFRCFPEWNNNDVVWIDLLFANLDRLQIGKKRRSSRR